MNTKVDEASDRTDIYPGGRLIPPPAQRHPQALPSPFKVLWELLGVLVERLLYASFYVVVMAAAVKYLVRG